MKFRPLHDRILIRRIAAEDKTKGGIIIPDTAKEKPVECEVVAVGPERGRDVVVDARREQQHQHQPRDERHADDGPEHR